MKAVAAGCACVVGDASLCVGAGVVAQERPATPAPRHRPIRASASSPGSGTPGRPPATWSSSSSLPKPPGFFDPKMPAGEPDAEPRKPSRQPDAEEAPTPRRR